MFDADYLKNGCYFPYYFGSMYPVKLSVHKTRPSLRFVGLFFGLAMLWAAAPTLFAQEGNKISTPELKLTKNTHDFGEIFVGEEVIYTFFMQNTGNAPLSVSETPISGASGGVIGLTMSPIEKAKYVGVQSKTSPVPMGCSCQLQEFYYDKVIQPGQIGIIRIILRGTDKLGATEAVYNLYSNDPRHAAFNVKVTGTVKAVPDYLKRVANANITNGEIVGSYRVYPTAKPDITIGRDEHLKLTIKIKATGTEDSDLKIAKPIDNAVVNLTKNAASEQYILEVEPQPLGAGGTRTINIPLQSTGGKRETLDVVITLHTPNNSIVFTPEVVNCGEVSLASLQSSPLRVGRVGVRKLVGNFKITGVTSSLTFLQPELQTMVEGSNYLIRINTTTTNLPKAGAYEGVIRVETDDPAYAKLEIPVKIVLTAK